MPRARVSRGWVMPFRRVCRPARRRAPAKRRRRQPDVFVDGPESDDPEIAPARRHAKYDRLIAAAREIRAVPTAVAHPCDETSLKGALDAAAAGMIEPILVGPEGKIRGVAEKLGVDIGAAEIVDVPHSHAAAAKAVELVRTGGAELIMKGSLHTDELLGEVTRRETGLRTERRISHVFIMDVPTYPKTLFITDAAVNIFPDLEAKRDIVQNAIDLHVGLGLGAPKVAILSAVETVTPNIPSTIDAAALCKMADRGQIVGAELDGPLAFDNAISPEAARIKGIRSAGRRAGPDPGRARPRSRQHAGQEPDVPLQRRCRRHRAGRARADHPDLARRRCPDAHGLLRRGGALCEQPAREAAGAGLSRWPRPSWSSTPAARASSSSSSRSAPTTGSTRRLKGQIDGIGTRPRCCVKGKEGRRS